MATKKPSPTPTVKPGTTRMGSMAKSTAKPKASSTPTLPSLAEYKESAAYKSGAMTYKEYLNYFKSRGGK